MNAFVRNEKDAETLRTLGAVKSLTSRAEAPYYRGEPIVTYFLTEDDREVAHYFHDMYSLSGLITNPPRQWGAHMVAQYESHPVK